jgi:RNA polymerase sigma factor (sigma-70 family)
LKTSPVNDVELRFRTLASGELRRSYRLAGLLVGSGPEAEDIVQDALTRAWRNMSRLRDPDKFQQWFDRIIVNACRDHLRRRRLITFAPVPDEALLIGTTDPFQAVLDRDEALGAMAGLDIEERAVIVLHYWADLTLEQVALRLGIPVGTAKTRLHRALRAMASVLGDRDREGSR